MKLLILLFRRYCVFLTYRRSPKSNFELEMVRERKFIKLILLQPKNIGIVHKIFIRKLISHGHSLWTCLSDLSVFSRSCSLVVILLFYSVDKTRTSDYSTDNEYLEWLLTLPRQETGVRMESNRHELNTKWRTCLNVTTKAKRPRMAINFYGTLLTL